MTTTDLDDMLAQLNAAKCLDFFENKSEKDRKVYWARVKEWLDVCAAFEFARSMHAIAQISMRQFLPESQQQQFALVDRVKNGELKFPAQAREKEAIEISRLAATCCAGLVDLRKLPLPEAEHAFAAMKNRKPKWLDKWLNYACQRNPDRVWFMVRSFEEENLTTAERGESYWLSMALCLGDLPADELVDYLADHADVSQTMVWQMFESEQAVRALSNPSGIFLQLSNRRLSDVLWMPNSHLIEAVRRASLNWKVVLAELAAGDADRTQRIAQLCFTWLMRLAADTESRSGSSIAGESIPTMYFQNFFDELKLSAQQKTAYALQFIGLLTVTDSSTLTWSIQKLQECNLADLPVDDLLAGLPRVFYRKRKEPALAALALAELIHNNSTGHIEQIIEIYLTAFEHSSPDIHKRAFAQLKRQKLMDHPVTLAGLAERTERANPILKKEITELLAASGASPELTPTPSESPVSAFSIDDVRQRVDQVPQEFARVLALPSLLACIEQPLSALKITSIDLNDPRVPRLSSDKKLKPVEELDDLIFLFLHVLEGKASNDDVERVMDGLARLGHLRPADLDSRVSSLRKKVQPIRELMSRTPSPIDPFAGTSSMIGLQVLAITWLDSQVAQKKAANPLMQLVQRVADQSLQLATTLTASVSAAYGATSPLTFFAERVRCLSDQLTKQISAPLLAAPTHAGGWIDPRVLASRLSERKASGATIDSPDLIQALLRLAPEHRATALEALPAGNDEYLRALVWGLGGELKAPMNSPELWVAAFRAREPRGVSEALKARFPELGPDSAVRAEYQENLSAYSGRSDSIYGTVLSNASTGLPLQVVPAVRYRPQIKFFPTELLHDNNMFFEGNNSLEQYWLQDRESYFAHIARRMALYLDSQGSYWQSSWEFIFDADVDLTGNAVWFLLFALSAKQTEVARLALDALIAGIDDGRLAGSDFGPRMARVLATGKVTLVRWSTALKETSRISVLHNHFVIQTLESFFAELNSDFHAKPPIPLMELLYESCQTAQYNLNSEAAIAFLKSVGGKGKAAKLANLLITLPTGKNTANRMMVLLATLDIRLQRAQRWESQQTR